VLKWAYGALGLTETVIKYIYENVKPLDLMLHKNNDLFLLILKEFPENMSLHKTDSDPEQAGKIHLREAQRTGCVSAPLAFFRISLQAQVTSAV
jgi:hypothetical protein